MVQHKLYDAWTIQVFGILLNRLNSHPSLFYGNASLKEHGLSIKSGYDSFTITKAIDLGSVSIT